MDQTFQRFAAALAINIALLGCAALAQVNAGGGSAAQPEASNSLAGPPQSQSLGELSRKGRQKDQQDQGSNPAPANKPRVYTEDSLTAAPDSEPSAPKISAESPTPKAGGKAPGPGETPRSPAKAKIYLFKNEKSTVKRPGATLVNWMVQNKSDHAAEFTFTFVVTGPCDYKSEQSETVELMSGAARGDSVLANPVFLESECPGEYSLELRVTSGGKLLDSAHTTVSVL